MDWLYLIKGAALTWSGKSFTQLKRLSVLRKNRVHASVRVFLGFFLGNGDLDTMPQKCLHQILASRAL